MCIRDRDSLNYNELGNLYYKTKKIIDAKEYYLKAIDLNPNVAVYYENLGLINEELLSWQEAADAYEKAVALDPTANLYNYLGLAYYSMKNYSAAIRNYVKAIELNKESAVFYNNLGLAYEYDGKIEEAEAAYLEAVKLEPDNY